MTEFAHGICRVSSRRCHGAREGFLPEGAVGWLRLKNGFALPWEAEDLAHYHETKKNQRRELCGPLRAG